VRFVGTRFTTQRGEAAGERFSADNSIIMTAVTLGAHSRQPVVLVSKDLAVRIKAEALGVAAQDYRNDKSTIFQRCGRLLDAGVACDVRSVVYRREEDQSGARAAARAERCAAAARCSHRCEELEQEGIDGS
jgi:predicted ribonuclease YlaK